MADTLLSNLDKLLLQLGMLESFILKIVIKEIPNFFFQVVKNFGLSELIVQMALI